MEQLQRGLAACMIGLVLAIALSVPALRSAVRSSQATGENRALAPLPKTPQSTADLLQYTRQLEPWINDHFGFRTSLIKLNNKLRYVLFGQFPTIQVISGREGRIFLSSHATTLPEYSAITIPCGYTFTSTRKVAGQLNALHESFLRDGLDARIMIVPSAPVIYPEALPIWLEARCHTAVSPIESALASPFLNTETRKAIYFPKTEMLALKETVSVFPKTWFHWAGAGAREVAGLSVKFFWNIPQHAGKAIAERSNSTPSDISHLFPGINLSSQVDQPDHAQSHIEACQGAKCFPDLGSAADKLQEVAFYRNLQAPQNRLVILSDSFGQFIAGWYPRYFKEVIHFSINSLNQLDSAETLRFKAYIKAQAQTGHLLLLYHDGSALWDRPAQDQEKLFAKHSSAVLR
jgi:hypothetical protein